MNKYRNGKNKKDNMAITFKVDKDIEDFVKNINKVQYLENQKKGICKDVSRTDLLNKWLRNYMLNILGVKTYNEEIIKQSWNTYKKVNGIEDWEVWI